MRPSDFDNIKTKTDRFQVIIGLIFCAVFALTVGIMAGIGFVVYKLLAFFGVL